MPPKTGPKSESQRILTRINNDIKKVQKHLAEAEDLKRLIMPRGILPKMGDISRQIYASGAIRVQDDDLSMLPNEVILMVLPLLAVPDRTCFALTCKQYAHLVESYKDAMLGKISLLPKRQQTRMMRRPTKIQRLAVLVQLHSWMPAKWRLCYTCLVYRKKSGADAEVAGKELATRKTSANDRWGGNSDIVRRKLVSSKAMVEGPRCPECVKRAELEMMHDRKEAKELIKLVKQLA